MPPKVIIDGYNLLHVSPELSVRREELLENARNRLIEKLSRYKRQKNVFVAIVFDGWKGGMPSQSQEILKGIKIIYSKLGEKADEVIKRIIANSSEEVVVVSSDREIRDFAEKHNTVSVSSSEFEKKIEEALFYQMKGYDEEDYEEREISTKKRGNPKKLSKAERKKRAKTKKL
jgi:predicted RNA-binding protein with PIN domain|tara:strand:+ start:9186 stop:9707 length:522 start_codon:yes stop_codon:yes gene_type:complete